MQNKKKEGANEIRQKNSDYSIENIKAILLIFHQNHI